MFRHKNTLFSPETIILYALNKPILMNDYHSSALEVKFSIKSPRIGGFCICGLFEPDHLLVKSEDVEPVDTEGLLYYAILHKGLVHSQIFVFGECPGSNPLWILRDDCTCIF